MNIGTFNVIPKIYTIFIIVIICYSEWVYSNILSSRSLMHSSVSFSLLFIASSELFSSDIE